MMHLTYLLQHLIGPTYLFVNKNLLSHSALFYLLEIILAFSILLVRFRRFESVRYREMLAIYQKNISSPHLLRRLKFVAPLEEMGELTLREICENTIAHSDILTVSIWELRSDVLRSIKKYGYRRSEGFSRPGENVQNYSARNCFDHKSRGRSILLICKNYVYNFYQRRPFLFKLPIEFQGKTIGILSAKSRGDSLLELCKSYLFLRAFADIAGLLLRTSCSEILGDPE